MVTTSGSTPDLEPASHAIEVSDNGVHGSTFRDNDTTPNNIAGNESSIAEKNSITNIFRWGVPKDTDAEQIKIAQALESRYASQADYSTRNEKGCMEGTREGVLDEIEAWIRDLEGPHVLWLTGMLGMGKTTIASTMCSRVSDNPDIVLGGSFFCSRLAPTDAQHDVRCVVPTLVQLLARQSATFAKALAEVLEIHPKVLDQQVGAQVKALLYTPLLALKNSPAPIVFVIDALDECGGQLTGDGAPNDIKTRHIISELVNSLIQFSPVSERLPVKFLVTSRPATHIHNAFAVGPTLGKILRLHDVPKQQVTADIRLYVTTILDELAPELLTENDISTLVEFSEGVFIVAAKTMQQIIQPYPEGAGERFEALFDVPRDQWSMAHLDQTYAPIMDDVERIDRVETGQQSWRRVLAVLLSTPVPVSVALLADLLVLRRNQLRTILSRLHAVVHAPGLDDDTELRLLHASFGDYLFRRAPDHIRISASLGHEILANRCFDWLVEDLHFNVSQSSSSLDQNSLEKRSGIHLSLQYACLHWAHHVSGLLGSSRFDPSIENNIRQELEQRMNDVFRPRLLFWIEIMSVLGQVQRAIAMLVLAAALVQSSELSCFFRDAASFIVSSREAIEHSTPHIYISALTFADKESLVYQEFAPLFTGLIKVEVSGITHHAAGPVMTLTGHETPVNSVECSPDGRILASGSEDGTVRIWDMRTGETVTTLAHGDDDAVRSVAFAPNIQRVASGTDSGIVYIWSLVNLKAVPHRLKGHSATVSCVLFSSNGSHLASASFDKTVRLWNAATNQQLALLRGHADKVHTLAFSPDGLALASGSEDRTIRIWNVFTMKLKSSHRQEESVYGVCFLDGDQIAAATGDRVMLYSAQTGSETETLYTGSETLSSIRSSPDGKSLVLACAKSIFFLNLPQSASTAGAAVTRLDALGGAIRSAAFSSDGLYIVSASDDRVIRVWNTDGERNVRAPTRQQLAAASAHVTNLIKQTDEASWGRIMSESRTLRGHSACLRGLVLPSDGAVIVSGSDDHTIRFWDAQSGDERLAPLREHTAAVYSVAISPDGRTIVSGSADNTVRLWNAETGKAIGQPMRDHTAAVWAVTFSPDSRWLASGAHDNTVRIWDVAGQCPSTVGPMSCDSGVYTVAISPDERLVAAGTMSGRVYLWERSTGQQTHEPLLCGSHVYSIAFSPDGTRIISCGECPTFIWNVKTGQKILTLDIGTRDYSAVYSIDGGLICAGSADHAVRLWDGVTGALIATLRGHTSFVWRTVFTPDGRSIMSGSGDGTIRIWKLMEPLSPAARNDARLVRKPIELTALPANGNVHPVVVLASAVLDDGWLKGPSGELLLWVPAKYRQYLHMQRSEPQHVILGSGDDGWHYGESWNSCWRTTA